MTTVVNLSIAAPNQITLTGVTAIGPPGPAGGDIDGGSASAVFSSTQTIDGGNA